MPKFVLLWTDAAMWLLALALVVYVLLVLRRPGLRANWTQGLCAMPPALASAVVLALCLGITLLDSVHYRPLLPPAAGSEGGAPAYDTRTRSLLDALLARLVDSREATYSRPLAYVGFTKESVEVDGEVQRVAPRLKFGGAHLQDPATQWLGDLAWRGAGRPAARCARWRPLLSAALLALVARRDRRPWREAHGRRLARRRPRSPGAWPA